MSTYNSIIVVVQNSFVSLHFHFYKNQNSFVSKHFYFK